MENSLSQAVSRLTDDVTSFLLPGSSGGTSMLIRKVGYGLVGAAYACMLLTGLLVAAVALGVGTVRMWAEEPLVVRESLHFDYTRVHPEASFSFGFPAGVPVGHTYYVSVVLSLPESDYNRHIGVFQLTAEVLSKSGTVVSRSSHPCMLQFRSPPIRLARTIIKSVPLLLGTTLEAQTLTVDLLKYRESQKLNTARTDSIRVTLAPRAGTALLPELYESHIVVRSQLPRHKELVRRWKWTFYVWTSFCSYVVLLSLVLCCFRPLVFPGRGSGETGARREVEERRREVEEMDAGTLRQWQNYRRKRKAEVLGRSARVEESVVVGSSITRDTDVGEEIGDGWGDGWGDVEEFADSSSICQ